MDLEHPLHRLARAHGLQAGYVDYTGTPRGADPDVLRAVLRALGASVHEDELQGQIDDLDRARWHRVVEPVLVAWDGQLTAVVRVPKSLCDAEVALQVFADGAKVIDHVRPLDAHAVVAHGRAGGVDHVAFAVTPGVALPPGYHRLEIRIGTATTERALVLSAPRRVWTPGDEQRHFGVFAPLYSLHSEKSVGMGDLGDLAELYGWIESRGGSVVATLPLLAGYLDEPCEPSPYVPTSRLAWNEIYLDFDALPELATCEAARKRLADPDTQKLIARQRAQPIVDHKAEMALRRRILDLLTHHLFERGGPRLAALEAFAKARPEIVDYARFRAYQERQRSTWESWPESARSGRLRDSDLDAVALRRHMYAQFGMHEQLAALAERTRGGGLGLYLDLPVGVHGHGFDTWLERDAFVRGLSTGAPPDLLFHGGQNWAFPPLHPERTRAAEHRYFIAMIQNHLRYAKVLRIDHVMGLHRLYVIPEGASAKDGVYLRYPADELYAILSIESHRSGTLLVGEDLGTVPPEVHAAMQEHGVFGMHVVEYAARAEGRALEPAPRSSVASVNTHDMPTFHAFWDGLDIDDRVALGWIDDDEAARDKRERARVRGNLRRQWAERSPLAPDADAHEAYRACVTELGDSEARLVLVSLDDLWGETKPHNVPGTYLERPNWRHRARHTIDELPRLPEVEATLRRLAHARRGPTPAGHVRHDVSLLSSEDLHFFNEGTHHHIADRLGAHPMRVQDHDGTYFAVWAPSAEHVAVVGDWNGWDGGRDPLRAHGSSGIWEGFVPGVRAGERYKFRVTGPGGTVQDKADPCARWAEPPPRTASLVADPKHRWRDEQWMAERADHNRLDGPMSIYEVHLGSWMRMPEEDCRPLGYREIAPKLAEHVQRMGFTHVELLPIMEHPFYGSWGYQTTGYFAPTARYGSPSDFMALVDTLHQAGIGVILDWVPSHFPTDGHGPARFDGTHLYEHADPRKGFHPDWQSAIFNYGRYEVQSFLLSSALWWFEQFHVDGLRVDAVASMLYLDYSRKDGEWIPNVHGGRENLEAIALLQRLNEAIYTRFPGVQTFAEESTAWPAVSRPPWLGGLGFGLKWDMGWMHDMLQYMSRDPVHRGHHQHELTFRMIYAFTENFVLALSHDEVVHGKGSLFGKMPGDRWQKFANLRALYGAMWGQPGKKLLFMGQEFAQEREWNHDISLDWHLLGDPMHEGVRRWVADLNALHRRERALHELDVDWAGFEWIDFSDAAHSVFAWMRRSRDGSTVAVVCNFTPVVRHDYRIGVPGPGAWIEIANSDGAEYGGSGVGNFGRVDAEPISAHGRPWSIRLVLPPLGVLMLRWGEP